MRHIEQANGFVRLDGDAGRELPVLSAWRNATSVFWVSTPFPLIRMVLKIGGLSGGYSHIVSGVLHPSQNAFRFYCGQEVFPDAVQTHYKIAGFDENNVRTVCGDGVLRVWSGSIADTEDVPVETTQRVFLRIGGVWYRLGITSDGVGLTYDLDTAPVVGFDSSEVRSPFAYNASDGLYYALTGTTDDDGNPTVEVAQTGVSAGAGVFFAANPDTGLWYRVEAETDEEGKNVLSINPDEVVK